MGTPGSGWCASIIRRGALLAALSIVAAACSGGDDDGGTSSGDDPSSWILADPYVKTSERVAGAFELRPGTLRLTPGSIGHVGLVGVDTTGAPASAAAFELVSSNDAVVRVSPDGTVEAVSLGIAEVRALVDGVTVANTSVEVLDVVPSGPTSVQFASPVLMVIVGAPTPITFEALDGAGNPADASAIRLALSTPSPPGFSLEGNTLTATEEGIAAIHAVLGDTPLTGALLVVAPPAPSRGPLPNCDPAQPELLGCRMSISPFWFARPGLAAPVLAFVTRYYIDNSCSPTGRLEITQEPPDVIRIERAGVLGAGPGAIGSVAPGATGVAGFVDGLGGQREVCGSWNVSVHPDLQGGWRAECANGDTGGLQLSVNYPDRDMVASRTLQSPFDGEGARNLAIFTRATGASCFHNDAEMFDCEGDAMLVYNHAGFGLSECGGARHGIDVLVENASRLNGPDSFEVGACTFTRGEVECCALPENPTPCFECVQAACPEVYHDFWCIPEACEHDICINQCGVMLEACDNECARQQDSCIAACDPTDTACTGACIAAYDECGRVCIDERDPACGRACDDRFPDGMGPHRAVFACGSTMCRDLCSEAGPTIRAECATRM